MTKLDEHKINIKKGFHCLAQIMYAFVFIGINQTQGYLKKWPSTTLLAQN